MDPSCTDAEHNLARRRCDAPRAELSSKRVASLGNHETSAQFGRPESVTHGHCEYPTQGPPAEAPFDRVDFVFRCRLPCLVKRMNRATILVVLQETTRRRHVVGREETTVTSTGGYTLAPADPLSDVDIRGDPPSGLTQNAAVVAQGAVALGRLGPCAALVRQVLAQSRPRTGGNVNDSNETKLTRAAIARGHVSNDRRYRTT